MKKAVKESPSVNLVEAKEVALATFRQAEPYLAWKNKLKIANDQELGDASDLLVVVKDLYKQLKAKYDSYREPLKQIQKLLDADFKPPMKELENLEQHIKYNLVSRYLSNKQAALIAKAEKKAEKEIVKGNIQYAEDLVKQAEVTKLAPEGIQQRESWSYEVEDMKALCLAVANGTAPIDTVLPNNSVLNGLAKVHKDSSSIPGVRFFKKMILAVGGI